MEAASPEGGERKVAAGKPEAKAMERQRQEEEEEKAAAAGQREERKTAVGQHETMAVRRREAMDSEDDGYLVTPTGASAATAISKVFTERGSTSSANVPYSVVLDGSTDDATVSVRDAVFVDCSCAKIDEVKFSVRDALRSEYRGETCAEFRDASLSARAVLFLDLAGEYSTEKFGNIFGDLPTGSSKNFDDAVPHILDSDGLNQHIKKDEDGSPLTDMANVDRSGKKKARKFRPMENGNSRVFPTARPSWSGPARQVRSFKQDLVPIEDPSREIIDPPPPAPPAEVFEDPIARLDSSAEKVNKKKAELLQAGEVSRKQLRKLDRDLTHLLISKKLTEEG